MKKLLFYILAVIALTACGQKDPYQTRWHWEEGTIVVETPAMPEGQQTALQMALDPIEVVHIGFAGLGSRGHDAINRYVYIDGVDIVALCDYEPAQVDDCNRILQEHGLHQADAYTGEEGYKSMCERADVNLIYIAADWDHHFPIAKYALEQHKNVAIEVPSAMNLSQIWQLIDLSERNRCHCMILENCCYDWFELTTLNMIQHGVLGEVLYAEGAYLHCLDRWWPQYWHNPDTIANPDNLSWRLKYNKEHRGDIYPTHGLGPVAQALNIHRGDRMKTLVAMDTKSVIGHELVENATGKPCEDFLNGDQTTTLIRTELGKVIEIQHNVMTPRPYDRIYQMVGTKGYAIKYPVEHYALAKESLQDAGVTPSTDDLSGHEFLPEAEHKALVEKWEHPLLIEYGKKAQEVGGHGGMDFIMDCRLIYCLHNGLPLDMDVYDLAEWCCLAELGALSLDHNSAAVAVPDFTRGHWNDVQGFQHAYKE